MKKYRATDHAGIVSRHILPPWGVRLHSHSGEAATIMLALEEDGDMIANGLTMVPYFTLKRDRDTVTRRLRGISEGINLGNEENRFYLTLRDDKIHLSGGQRCNKDIAIVSLEGFRPDSIGFILSPGAGIEVSDIILNIGDAPHYNISHDTFPDLITLEDYLSQSRDQTEGYWQILDYNLDDSLLRRGGDYRVAIVRRASGYDILYLGGATTMSTQWKPLMLKGELHDTAIEGVYDLIWYDAMGSPMSYGLKAQVTDDNIITLNFPAQSSTLCLHRILAR